MSPYAPDFDVDRARGQEAEELYRKCRTWMINGTAEVKRDDAARKYGNVYVEYECLRRGEWRPSGISITRAHTWVFVCWPIIVAIPVSILRQVFARARPHGSREMNRGSHPTRGVVIPLRDLLPHAVEAANAPLTEEAAA